MKKISINTVKAFMKENKSADTCTHTFSIGDRSFEVTFRTALSVYEKSAFINRVISGCFDLQGRFRPEYVVPMVRATVIQMCTDIPALTMKSQMGDGEETSLDINAMNELYIAMGLDDVDNHEYQYMLDEMTDLCNQAIEWTQRSVLADRGLEGALKHFLDALTEKVENVNTDDLMQYAKQLSEVTYGMSDGDIVNKLIELKDYRSANE